MADKTFIMAAPNGARRTKADHPALPMSPAEIAAECMRCHEAGAAAVHLHARHAVTGEHVLDPAAYADVEAAVKDATAGDLVIQLTTECVSRFPPSAMMALVRARVPESASYAISELIPSPADEPVAGTFLAWSREARIINQYILYSADEVARFANLHARGIVPERRPLVLFVLGRYTPGQVSVPGDLDAYLDAWSKTGIVGDWAICAFGRAENACIRYALERGGHGRVGFENNLHRPDGQPAASNADLVAAARHAADELGRPVMTAADLRAWAAGRET